MTAVRLLTSAATKRFMERFHVKNRRAMGAMNRFTERDSPESQRVSHFQRCGTRPPHSTPLTRCGSATRGPTVRFMERTHVKNRRAMGAMNQTGHWELFTSHLSLSEMTSSQWLMTSD